MSNKRMAIAVAGKSRKWQFTVYANPKHLKAWQDDGLDIVLIENTIPSWVAEMGMTRVWCFLQDVFNFKNPWRSSGE